MTSDKVMMAPNPKIHRINENHERANLKGDRLNFLLLVFLYLLQGTVHGIAFAIPTIVQNRGVTYGDQGEFNFIWYPLAVKILWAPIVDSIYFRKIGRRKTWLLMAQLCIGALLFLLSMNADNLMGTENGERRPNVRTLAAIFFVCILSNSIQDIAVDGWSLTLLQKRNVAYAAVCQNTGLVFGRNVIPAGLIILESKDFGNTVRSVFGSAPQSYGLVSFSQFFLIFSLLIVISTILILIFKKEDGSGREYSTKMEDDDDDECRLSMREAYLLVWKILKKRPIQIFALLLITMNLGVAPVQNVATLKLLDCGISRDTLATIGLLIVPLQLVLPFLLDRCLTGRRQLSLFLFFFVLRFMNSYAYSAYIFLISYWKNEYNALPTWYYGPLLIIRSFENATYGLVMVTTAAFCARISDPRFGGVYLTLLYSMTNLGDSWISSLCLWSVNFLTITSCSADETSQARVCHTTVDGFHVQVFVFSLVGVLWMFWARRTISYLERIRVSAFRVKHSPTSKELSTFVKQPVPLVIKDRDLNVDAIRN